MILLFFFSKYTYNYTHIYVQSIKIDYRLLSTGDFKIIITKYRQNPVFYFDISNLDHVLTTDDLFNTSSIMNYILLKETLSYFNIEDEQGYITNLTTADLTTEGTYIIKTGSTLHTIPNLDKVIKFPEDKAPTFEVNKTYILKVTYNKENNNYYCTDIKSFSNT